MAASTARVVVLVPKHHLHEYPRSVQLLAVEHAYHRLARFRARRADEFDAQSPRSRRVRRAAERREDRRQEIRNALGSNPGR